MLYVYRRTSFDGSFVGGAGLHGQGRTCRWPRLRWWGLCCAISTARWARCSPDARPIYGHEDPNCLLCGPVLTAAAASVVLLAAPLQRTAPPTSCRCCSASSWRTRRLGCLTWRTCRHGSIAGRPSVAEYDPLVPPSSDTTIGKFEKSTRARHPGLGCPGCFRLILNVD